MFGAHVAQRVLDHAPVFEEHTVFFQGVFGSVFSRGGTECSVERVRNTVFGVFGCVRVRWFLYACLCVCAFGYVCPCVFACVRVCV